LQSLQKEPEIEELEVIQEEEDEDDDEESEIPDKEDSEEALDVFAGLLAKKMASKYPHLLADGESSSKLKIPGHLAQHVKKGVVLPSCAAKKLVRDLNPLFLNFNQEIDLKKGTTKRYTFADFCKANNFYLFWLSTLNCYFLDFVKKQPKRTSIFH
jgi:hypothetical protein